MRLSQVAKSVWRGMSIDAARTLKRTGSLAGTAGSTHGDNGRRYVRAGKRQGRVALFEEGKTRPLWEGSWHAPWAKQINARDGRPGRGSGGSVYQQATFDPKDMPKLKLKRIENVNATTFERATSWPRPDGRTRYQMFQQSLRDAYGGSVQQRRERVQAARKARLSRTRDRHTGAAWGPLQVSDTGRSIYESFNPRQSLRGW